jgi:hypothetical protein
MRARRLGSCVVVCVLWVLHAGSACAQESDTPALADDALVRAVRASEGSVARVRCGDARVGTAFAVGAGDRLVTTWRVADCPRRLSVEGRDGARVTARVAASDEDHDLALLVADGLALTPLAVQETPTAIGQRVVVIGQSGGARDLVAYGGEVGQATDEVVRTDAAYPGSLGGPALDSEGRVVGVVASGLDAIAHVVPARWVLSLADEAPLEGEVRAPVRFHFGVGLGTLVLDGHALFAAEAHVSADLWDELSLRIALQVAGGTTTDWAPQPTERSESLVSASAAIGYRFHVQLDDAIALTITPEIGAWVGLRTTSETQARLGFADPSCNPSSAACALTTSADMTTAEQWLARPTLGLRMALDLIELGYQVQLDVEHPEASGHLVTFGFTL